MKSKTQKILFIVNPASGSDELDYNQEISKYFDHRKEEVEIFELSKIYSVNKITSIIKKAQADRIVAVGGDGTIKLVAECLVGTEMPLGIIPAGSANGMAKELNIPLDLNEALNLVINGKPKYIHAISVNGELCIHLADIGFNAYLIKKFDELPTRGMWTYAKAAWHAFRFHRKMDVSFKVNGKLIKQQAAMIAIANATKYGTGLEINPKGKLNDKLFEIILIKEYSVLEILKIWTSNLPWNPEKIEVFQTDYLQINTTHNVHFQVDGEYLGKVKKIEAQIIPKAIQLIY